MNIKRILAAASASVVAVSAMAVTSAVSFAETETKEFEYSVPFNSWNATEISTDDIVDGIDFDSYVINSISLESTGPISLQYGAIESSNWWVETGVDTSFDISDIGHSGNVDGGKPFKIITNVWCDAELDENGDEVKDENGDIVRSDKISDTDWHAYEGHEGETFKVTITIDYEAKPAESDDDSSDDNSDDKKDDTSSSKPEESKPEESKPEESKPEESKPEESKPVVDNTPKIKPAYDQDVPNVTSGPADQRPVPSIGYKDGTTNNGGNSGNSGDSGNSGNSGDSKPTDPTTPTNPSTGVAIAFAPALLAGAAVVVAKKRK